MRAFSRLLGVVALFSLGAATALLGVICVLAFQIRGSDVDWKPAYDDWLSQERTDEARALLLRAYLAEIPSASLFLAERYRAGDDVFGECEGDGSLDCLAEKAEAFEMRAGRRNDPTLSEYVRMTWRDLTPAIGDLFRRGFDAESRSELALRTMCLPVWEAWLQAPSLHLGEFLYAHTGDPSWRTPKLEARIGYCREAMFDSYVQKIAPQIKAGKSLRDLAVRTSGEHFSLYEIAGFRRVVARGLGSDAATFEAARLFAEGEPRVLGDQYGDIRCRTDKPVSPALRQMEGALDIVELARRDFEPAKWYLIRRFQDGNFLGPSRAVAAYWLRRASAAVQSAALESRLSETEKADLALLEEKGPYAMLLIAPFPEVYRECNATDAYGKALWDALLQRYLSRPLR
ncbi:MAG: hypothetical protein H6923_02910 [Alphaproteobacteria bacterium]|nr:hypothetical protein [Alphaproteobacteria bacterium]